MARAASFGLTFAQPARVVLARERTQRRDGRPPADVAGLGDALERALAAPEAPRLRAVRAAGAIALVQCGDPELGAAVAPLLEDERPLVIGIGRPASDLAEVRHSLRDAELAVERLGYDSGQQLLAFEDFDLGTLLLSEAASERIDPKVEGLLAPLRAHPLLHDAIGAYFEHEMDVGRTAQALCLHPNTLRYRLGRLEELLGLSLKQPAAVTALYVALVAGERPGD